MYENLGGQKVLVEQGRWGRTWDLGEGLGAQGLWEDSDRGKAKTPSSGCQDRSSFRGRSPSVPRTNGNVRSRWQGAPRTLSRKMTKSLRDRQMDVSWSFQYHTTASTNRPARELFIFNSLRNLAFVQLSYYYSLGSRI